MFLKILTYFLGMLYILVMFHRDILCTLLNAFLKSIKLTNNACWKLTHCSIMLQSVKICSTHDCPWQNLACCSCSLVLIASHSCLSSTEQKSTWDGQECYPVPFVTVHYATFFGNFTIMLLFFWVAFFLAMSIPAALLVIKVC